MPPSSSRVTAMVSPDLAAVQSVVPGTMNSGTAGADAGSGKATLPHAIEEPARNGRAMRSDRRRVHGLGFCPGMRNKKPAMGISFIVACLVDPGILRIPRGSVRL